MPFYDPQRPGRLFFLSESFSVHLKTFCQDNRSKRLNLSPSCRSGREALKDQFSLIKAIQTWNMFGQRTWKTQNLSEKFQAIFYSVLKIRPLRNLQIRLFPALQAKTINIWQVKSSRGWRVTTACVWEPRELTGLRSLAATGINLSQILGAPRQLYPVEQTEAIHRKAYKYKVNHELVDCSSNEYLPDYCAPSPKGLWSNQRRNSESSGHHL